ncbi:ASN_collapsed_G0039730.mRNA.1.CDS.1 [Saccharomyces cerevisiae]|nr:ASN_collapsed_G0039730.mRNA.1.CDS.1 [Saccharomyces cerevisiae]
MNRYLFEKKAWKNEDLSGANNQNETTFYNYFTVLITIQQFQTRLLLLIRQYVENFMKFCIANPNKRTAAIQSSNYIMSFMVSFCHIVKIFFTVPTSNGFPLRQYTAVLVTNPAL